MTETTTAVTANTTKKVAKEVVEKIAETNIAPSVVETAEVALQVPSKFVVSTKLALVGVACAVAGAGALYGAQKLRGILAAKKASKVVVPNDASELTEKNTKN